MWAILEALPKEDKIGYLRRFAIHVALKKMAPLRATGSRVAEYFGMQRTYISRVRSENERDALLQNCLTQGGTHRQEVEAKGQGERESCCEVLGR